MTEPVLPENELQPRIGERLADGRLPAVRPAHIAAGYGQGSVCAGCGEAIQPKRVEYDVSVAGKRLRFHFACFVIWQRMCSP